MYTFKPNQVIKWNNKKEKEKKDNNLPIFTPCYYPEVPLVLFPSPNFTLKLYDMGLGMKSIFVISSLRIIKVSYPLTSNLYM